MEYKTKRKFYYFFRTNYRHRKYAQDGLNKLRQYGDIVLIGGMLRDIILFGNWGFKSDLDCVIKPKDINEFDKYMMGLGAHVNKFGGYAIQLNRWKIEVWPLERTWAHVNRHVNVSDFKDLRKVTFFNCDAIIYDLNQKSFIVNDSYFDDLSNRILEINLKPNPNPTGNAVRAFRYALTKGFHWGPNLMYFMAEVIDSVGWDDLRKSELRSFNTQYIDLINRDTMNRALNSQISTSELSSFSLSDFERNKQLKLPVN